MSTSMVTVMRDTEGYAAMAAFANAQLPLDQVSTRISEQRVCRLRTPESTDDRPRYEEGEYYLQPNGSVVEATSERSVSAMIGPRVVIHAGVKIENAIVHADVEVGQRTTLKDDSTVEARTRLGKSGLLGMRSSVGKDSVVGDGFKIIMSSFGPKCEIGINVTAERSTVDGSLHLGDFGVLRKANIAPNVKIGDGFNNKSRLTVLSGVRLGKHCMASTDVRIASGVVVGDFGYINDGATLHDKVSAAEFLVVGKGAHIDVGAILGKNVVIGDRAYVGPAIEIGDDSTVTDGSHIASRKPPMPIWPIPTRTFEVLPQD